MCELGRRVREVCAACTTAKRFVGREGGGDLTMMPVVAQENFSLMRNMKLGYRLIYHSEAGQKIIINYIMQHYVYLVQS